MRMNKRDWVRVLAPLPAVIAFDQLTKAWAQHRFGGVQFIGPFGLVLIKNPGFMLGGLADLPGLLRVVSLSTSGGFLAFLYGAFQHLLPGRHLALRIGVSLLLGGILGNIVDRITAGAVTDFLVLGSPSGATPAFNVADIAQWAGIALAGYELFRHKATLWPEDEARGSGWVNRRFQLKYCAILVGNGIAFAVILGVFAYTFLELAVAQLAPGAHHRYLQPFLEIYAIVSVAFLAALFWLGKALSHRIAGPLYSFERYLDELLAGRAPGPLRLRAGDEFRHLEELAQRLEDSVKPVGRRD